MPLSLAPLLAVLASVFLLTGVGAHQGFQPALQPPAIHSLRSNATSGNLDRRWLAKVTGTGPGDTHLWPDKTITFAFNSLKDQNAILPNFKKALNLWDAAGLSKHEYKWVPTTLAKCKSDRVNCLLIEAKEGAMLSTPGKPPANPETGLEGPFMQLDTVEGRHNLWPLELNYAHEMGHAWGLGHEHQNSAFWPAEYDPASLTGKSKRKGTAFGPKNFLCEKAPDYQEALAKANDKSRPNYLRLDAQMMCTLVTTALKLGFSASAVLPIHQGWYSEKSDLSQGPDDVDWDSIMLYSTRIVDPPFLFKPDGSDIPFPAGPSVKDVQGIQRMYDANHQTRNDAPLLNSGANAKQGIFKRLFCGCCSGE